MGAHGGGINRRVRSSAAIDDALPRAWSAGDSCDLDGLGDGSSGSGLALHARSGSSDGHDSLGSLASGRGSGDGEAFDARRHPGETLLQFCVDAASGASAADGAPDETCKRGEVALRVADNDRQSARHLQPDMPLVYVSITSSVLLLYFVAFVDTPSMMRLFTPLDVDETPGLEQLHTGFSAGASILLGFFVWLLHALLYDIVGMVVGLPPAAITFGCSFAYRVVARNNGYLIFAMLAVVLGLEAGRRGMAWDARRRRRRLAGYRPSGKALVGSLSAIGMGGSHTHSSSLRRSTSSTASDLTGEEGQMVDLYIPRKCSYTNRLIGAKDHSSVQLNIAHLDENGVYTGQFTTFAMCGFIRSKGEADSALDNLWKKKKAEIGQNL